jgi:hypothetical protein
MTQTIVNQSAKEPKRRKCKPASAHQIAVNRANAAQIPRSLRSRNP